MLAPDRQLLDLTLLSHVLWSGRLLTRRDENNLNNHISSGYQDLWLLLCQLGKLGDLSCARRQIQMPSRFALFVYCVFFGGQGISGLPGLTNGLVWHAGSNPVFEGRQ